MKPSKFLFTLFIALSRFAIQSVEAGEFENMLEPQIGGRWKVAEVYIVKDDNKLTPYDITNLYWNDIDDVVLPIGLEVSFFPDQDPITGEALSIMEMHTMGDKTLCKHPTFGHSHTPGACDQFPETIRKEFNLWFERKPDSLEEFKIVGANKDDILYEVRIGSDWFAQFFVLHDNQTMWSNLDLVGLKDGKRILGSDVYAGYQRWVRLK
ncbi:hypothetical protein [Methylobacter sp. YRD-M1]|uniref:hypothetical protein n=1 Tax=Methylobacter sp. YRD-M1 TaxID=2911520 RepID=UPI00227C7870|nr:hypothetical protein [Methylobacter sp. YRD-M1]WAK00659.1 hypothetical protein LZ558_12455 [Methylobacter sp. YRD-M1]